MTGPIPSAPGAVATPRASAPRGAIAAWGLWDWAFSAFNAVATTFVFNTYLSGKAFGDPAHESELLGVFTAVTGVIIAVAVARAGRHRCLTTTAAARQLVQFVPARQHYRVLTGFSPPERADQTGRTRE